MSTTPRLFVDQPLEPGRAVPATPGQAHYLGSVLRRGVGDAVVLFNGRDGEWAGRIASLRKDRALLEPEALLRPQAPPGALRLAVAVLKRDAMEWVVEKATELGVAVVQPVVLQRCVADRVNLARLAAIAQEAAEQCERLTVPEVRAPLPLHAMLDGWDGAPLLVGAERAAAPPLAVVAAGLARGAAACWLVGPEGGLAAAELDGLRRHAFVSAVSLGPRILRAETAAVAGLAILQALAGDRAPG